ncbi:MAG TPA: nuclear transport factor 2 family protein [Aequorivita sp.]|nr:nuclear transport factor 2 family protein [Aequorivita sp.]
MKNSNHKISTYLALVSLGMFLIACNNKSTSDKSEEMVEVNATEKSDVSNEKEFTQVMQKHLDAVSNRDLKSLGETMDPNGQMQLILPKTEIINGVEGFMDYHKEWFADSTWTFETKILNTAIGQDMGMAITEIVYREPERKPEPYFNRMIVSYDLKKIEGKWYIIKDHASSIEKSTDPK